MSESRAQIESRVLLTLRGLSDFWRVLLTDGAFYRRPSPLGYR